MQAALEGPLFSDLGRGDSLGELPCSGPHIRRHRSEAPRLTALVLWVCADRESTQVQSLPPRSDIFPQRHSRGTSEL